MLEQTAAYRAAITGDARRVLLRAVVDIVDPDITYGAALSQSAAPFSIEDQLHDKDMALTPYATVENNRWLLDGSFPLLPGAEEEPEGQLGFAGDLLSGADGSFLIPQFVELTFSNTAILQACAIYFSDREEDGFPIDFTVEVKQGGTAYLTRSFSDNRERAVFLEGFTVHTPDAIRVTVTRWSLPGRRMRVCEIVPGIYEVWDGDQIADFSVKQQGDPSCAALPYGTCSIRMDNLDRRFEPRSKNGLFRSITERQAIQVSMGVRLADGTDEYKGLGVFYQANGGWRTGDNGLSMGWDLMDIIGLLAGRTFLPPETLPTTLAGWLEALAAQLGENFRYRVRVDPSYAGLPVMAGSAADVAGKSCGDLLRFVCMATGTFPRADAATGFLTAEPCWDQGNRLELDNMKGYPVMKANDDLAAVLFKLYDGSGSQYVVSGNATASSQTITVDNPFLHTRAAALGAARQLLSARGGNLLEVTGRGDMSSEIGDVDTIWLDRSSAVTARRVRQDLSFSEGVLKDCGSTLLQADGSFLFQERAALTQSGSWTAPVGVGRLRLILVGKGQDGGDGQDGTWEEAGAHGAPGSGGKVWAGTVDINPGQTFQVTVGEDTVFGGYSSANGTVFPEGYTDVASGDSFARTGVTAPRAGSGDGGAGGRGGEKGNRRTESIQTENEDGSISTSWETVVDNVPGTGTLGKPGALGCVVIWWEKEAEPV